MPSSLGVVPTTTARAPVPSRSVLSRSVLWKSGRLATVLLGGGLAVAAALLATLALGGDATSLLGRSTPPWWAEPALRAVRDVAAVLTTGLLLVSCGVLASQAPSTGSATPGGAPSGSGTLPSSARPWLLGCSAVAAAATAGHLLVLTTEVSGTGPLEPGGAGALVDVLRTVDVARLPVYAVGALLYVAFAASRARQARDLRLPAGISLLAVALLGVAGHAGGHPAAMSMLAVHVLAASAWAGGLAALFLLRLGHADVAALLPRYSRIAAGCLAAVTGSGLVAVALRWDGGGTGATWALLAALKLVVVAALVVLGLQQRRRVVAPAVAGSPLPWRVLVRLGLVELLLMATAAGLGVALSSSAAA